MVGDGTLSDNLKDVFICTTGPLGIPEMYVSDNRNDRIAVLDPLTGGHIRYIGRGQGEGMYIIYVVGFNNCIGGHDIMLHLYCLQ